MIKKKNIEIREKPEKNTSICMLIMGVTRMSIMVSYEG